jgi:hypothetical protein
MGAQYKKISIEAAKQGWIIKEAGQPAEQVTDRAAVACFDDPNPESTGAQLLDKTSQLLDLDGNTLWVMPDRPNVATMPRQIWPMHRKGWKPEFEQGTRTLIGWTNTETGKRLLPWQVLHFKLPSHADAFWGPSPLQAAAVPAGVDLKSQSFQEKYYENAGMPGGKVETEGQLTDPEFEAFLLEVLSDFQVSVPELGTLQARHVPGVLLTSNNTRELSEALKRRCLYTWIGFPEQEREVQIVRSRLPHVTDSLAAQVVSAVNKLRAMELEKLPGVAETIDWAESLDALGVQSLTPEAAIDTLGAVVKDRDDLDYTTKSVLDVVS